MVSGRIFTHRFITIILFCHQAYFSHIELVLVNNLLLRDYVNKFKKSNESFDVLMENDSYFREKLTQYLFSPKGAIFQVAFLLKLFQ